MNVVLKFQVWMQNKNEKLSFGRKIFGDRYKLLKLGQVMSSQSQLLDCFIAFLKNDKNTKSPPKEFVLSETIFTA